MPSTYRWVILALTIVGFMQTHLHRMAFAPLIPFFVTDLGLTYAAAGTIQTAYFWTYALVQVPIGMVADRWGPRRVMVACMVVLAGGALAFAAATSYGGSIAARMLIGLGAAAVWVPGMRLISEWFPAAERGRATGLMSSGGGLGATLGLVLVPWLAGAVGWRAGYAMLAAPAFVTAVLLACFVRTAGGVAPVAGPRGRLTRVLASKALWPFNVSVCLSFGGYFSFITFLPASLVKGMGFTPAEAGLTTSLITAATIVSWPLTGALSDRLGVRKPFYQASQAVSVLACLAFAWPVPILPPAAAMVVALLTGLLVGGMILPFVMIVDLFPRDLAATAAGVGNSACFVGAMVLPIVLGRVVDLTGSFAPAFLVAGVVQFLALVAGCFVIETGSRHATGSARGR
jgi:MFS family permease